MMQHHRREWIMIRESILSRADREQELENMHLQLRYQEDPEQLSQVLEVVDLNRYKVIKNYGLVKKYILSRDKKNFCFLFFKN
jgi:hypothetical protein